MPAVPNQSANPLYPPKTTDQLRQLRLKVDLPGRSDKDDPEIIVV
jgi:hypothetical protein